MHALFSLDALDTTYVYRAQNSIIYCSLLHSYYIHVVSASGQLMNWQRLYMYVATCIE